MPKIDLEGWKRDKARREARVSSGLCPMCGKPKRPEDEFCSDACKSNSADGRASLA